MYIRDDRDGVEELRLCEVEVYGIPLERGEHALPLEPGQDSSQFPHSTVPKRCPPVSLKNGESLVVESPSTDPSSSSPPRMNARFSCQPGFVLWGSQEARCLFEGR